MGGTDQEFARLIGIKKFHKAKAFIEQVKGNQMEKMIHMRHQLAGAATLPTFRSRTAFCIWWRLWTGRPVGF